MSSPGGQVQQGAGSNGGSGDPGNQGNSTQTAITAATSEGFPSSTSSGSSTTQTRDSTSEGFPTSTSSSSSSTTQTSDPTSEGFSTSTSSLNSSTTQTSDPTSERFPTPTSSLDSLTTQTSQPTSISASSSSTPFISPPSFNKTAVIGGVVGGGAGLLVLTLILICCLNKRKKKQKAMRNRTVQPVSYAGLNSEFAGVPFTNRPTSSLTPTRLLLNDSRTNSSHPDIEMRGGGYNSPAESDMFLPKYAESQAGMSIRATSSLARLNTTYTTTSTPASPLSAGAHHIVDFSPSYIPPVPPLAFQSRERDTMGFPVESGPLSPSPPSLASPSPGFETIHIEPEIPTPIVSPRPRYPMHQDSLERQIRQGMESPEPSQVINPNRLRVLSQEIIRESPILGYNTVSIVPGGRGMSGLNPNSGMGIERMDSVRSVSSMGSFMPAVVSDAELESLGVGVRPVRRDDNFI